MKAILGKKVGMTQIFEEGGRVTPVTLIEAGPCYIIQKKTMEKDGYMAVQLGFEEIKESRLNKPKAGHLKKADAIPLRYLREFHVDDQVDLEMGQKIDVSIFEVGDVVDVTGTSKGKGFAGVVKRHSFGGGPKTHGASDRVRAPGAIGAGTTPGRVFKGLRMAGQMGNEKVTILNLRVKIVDPEKNLLAVAGSIPGADKGLVMIREAVKSPKKST